MTCAAVRFEGALFWAVALGVASAAATVTAQTDAFRMSVAANSAAAGSA